MNIGEMVEAASALVNNDKVTIKLLLPPIQALQRRIEVEIQPNELFVSGQIEGPKYLSGYNADIIVFNKDPNLFRLVEVFYWDRAIDGSSRKIISFKPTYDFTSFINEDTEDCPTYYAAEWNKLFIGLGLNNMY